MTQISKWRKTPVSDKGFLLILSFNIMRTNLTCKLALYWSLGRQFIKLCGCVTFCLRHFKLRHFLLKSPSRIPDPWPMVRAWGRVTRKEHGAEWKWKFGSPHYLQSYHYHRPGSALTKLLTQTFAHSQHSDHVSWPDKLHLDITAHFGKILTPLVWYFAITGVIFGTCLI